MQSCSRRGRSFTMIEVSGSGGGGAVFNLGLSDVGAPVGAHDIGVSRPVFGLIRAV